ncbi:hypothetical protein JZ751_002571 [Albula glossodonta]|uniref:Uncharacterized protein n=1 Tax=Albula glossodonta TaxID=121402 RepID=A0A8T2N8F3_9TELE|nr:hypothetical protein JZ751_002571 [Albula glossodonta]
MTLNKNNTWHQEAQQVLAYLPPRRAVAVSFIVEIRHTSDHPVIDLGQGDGSQSYVVLLSPSVQYFSVCISESRDTVLWKAKTSSSPLKMESPPAESCIYQTARDQASMRVMKRLAWVFLLRVRSGMWRMNSVSNSREISK